MVMQLVILLQLFIKFLDKIKGMNENKELIAAEDYNAWLRIAQLTDQFLYLPKRLGYYLIHDQSVSRRICQYQLVMQLTNLQKF